jgi:hypothetical protein
MLQEPIKEKVAPSICILHIHTPTLTIAKIRILSACGRQFYRAAGENPSSTSFVILGGMILGDVVNFLTIAYDAWKR